LIQIKRPQSGPGFHRRTPIEKAAFCQHM